MKLAIAASGPELDSPLCPQFGRAPLFLIHDTATGETTAADNTQSLSAAQGAGIQAAENVARAGVQGLIAVHCGPKAFRVLSAAGIDVFLCPGATAAEAIEQFRQGRLACVQCADVEGHWV